MSAFPFYQVDAFTDHRLRGNPAAVCILESDWLDDAVMQAIAAENNLSETAFIIPAMGDAPHKLRWFTPTVEVEICGHATLASGHVLLRERGHTGAQAFETQSGILTVEPQGETLLMRLPASDTKSSLIPHDLERVLRARPLEVGKGGGFLVVVIDSVERLRALAPRSDHLMAAGAGHLIVTALGSEGDGCDYACRVFAPESGIPEDPVTGSAHAILAPFWAKRLKKDVLDALQVSERGGAMTCRVEGDKVALTGQAVTVITGAFHL
ncbi:MAG: PhzF family phenazine biosynthesis protein [Rhodospirillum sp.]|nr:PhzF family phenazine biosynthesis protein [Rhodospirillum sp.]MCF8488826.1 PhzF family phenazine biosynthesis protein [Rhodospirillum sp.]MCF8500908.1 PhzF family phenazine biosynthesis protein [Rhodospirillum sp.]